MGVPKHASLFGDDAVASETETLLENADRIEKMATLLVDEVRKFKARVKANQPPPPTPGKPALAAVTSAPSQHTASIRYFDSVHRSHVRDPETGAGIGAVISGARDGATIKRLLATHGSSLVAQCIDQYFRKQDQFTKSRGYTIGGLSQQFPSLLASLNRSSAHGVTDRTSGNQQSAEDAVEMIERMGQ